MKFDEIIKERKEFEKKIIDECADFYIKVSDEWDNLDEEDKKRFLGGYQSYMEYACAGLWFNLAKFFDSQGWDYAELRNLDGSEIRKIAIATM